MSYLITIKNLEKDKAEDVTAELDIQSLVPLLGYIIKCATTAPAKIEKKVRGGATLKKSPSAKKARR